MGAYSARAARSLARLEPQRACGRHRRFHAPRRLPAAAGARRRAPDIAPTRALRRRGSRIGYRSRKGASCSMLRPTAAARRARLRLRAAARLRGSYRARPAARRQRCSSKLVCEIQVALAVGDGSEQEGEPVSLRGGRVGQDLEQERHGARGGFVHRALMEQAGEQIFEGRLAPLALGRSSARESAVGPPRRLQRRGARTATAPSPGRSASVPLPPKVADPPRALCPEQRLARLLAFAPGHGLRHSV